jgi:hypothetical protein
MTNDEIQGKTVSIVGRDNWVGTVISSYSYNGQTDAVDVELENGAVLMDLCPEDVVIL